MTTHFFIVINKSKTNYKEKRYLSADEFAQILYLQIENYLTKINQERNNPKLKYVHNLVEKTIN